MVEEALSNFGLFIDSENKIRLIDPEKVTDSAELRDECKDFVDSMRFSVFFFSKFAVQMYWSSRRLLIR